MTWEAPLQDGSLARPIPCIMGCPRERYLPGAVSSLQVPLGLRSAALMEEPPAPWLLPPQFPSRQVPVPVQGGLCELRVHSCSTRAPPAPCLPAGSSFSLLLKWRTPLGSPQERGRAQERADSAGNGQELLSRYSQEGETTRVPANSHG